MKKKKPENYKKNANNSNYLEEIKSQHNSNEENIRITQDNSLKSNNPHNNTVPHSKKSVRFGKKVYFDEENIRRTSLKRNKPHNNTVPHSEKSVRFEEKVHVTVPHSKKSVRFETGKFETHKVDIVPGKIITIGDSHIIIGKRKGLLAALGIVNKKYIGILDEKGKVIKNPVKIKEKLNQLKGEVNKSTPNEEAYKFKDDRLLSLSTIPMDDKLLFYKTGQLAGIKKGIDGKLMLYKNGKFMKAGKYDKIIKHDKSYAIKYMVNSSIDTKATKAVTKKPLKGILKNSKTEAIIEKPKGILESSETEAMIEKPKGILENSKTEAIIEKPKGILKNSKTEAIIEKPKGILKNSKTEAMIEKPKGILENSETKGVIYTNSNRALNKRQGHTYNKTR